MARPKKATVSANTSVESKKTEEVVERTKNTSMEKISSEIANFQVK